jgi:hypothetical protein
LVCEYLNGPPPPNKPQAAHKCGNRSCINGLHVYWASQSDNEHDKIEHGTAIYGEKNHSTKLTASDVLSIRKLASFNTTKDLSELFNISSTQILRIIKRRHWAWLSSSGVVG